MFPTIPPTKATGLGPPSAPTPNTQGPPFQYGHPGPVGSQYYAAGMGVGAPQLYYGAPPYPPFSHHGNAGPWGYGQYPGAVPNPLPPPGNPQPRSAAVQAKVAPKAFQPKRIYPNKEVSDGGMLHRI